MSEKTIQFNDIILNKKEFHKSKEPIDLFSAGVDQIVVSYKFKYNNKSFKRSISYKEGDIVKPLCNILPQMSGYIKYFENGNKNMSFLIEDDEVWDRYGEIWCVIKDKLGIKFHSELVYEHKYLKAKVREFDGMIKTKFLGNDKPKENMHYTCMDCITIDSVVNFDKKNHPQVYLEESKYKTKKMQMSRFINTELKSDSESSDSDLESEKIGARVDNELEKSGSDSE